MNNNQTMVLASMTEVKIEKVRTDGKVSRKYYTARFTDPSNPFAPAVSRNIWQQHNNDGTSADWKVGNPDLVRTFLQKEIPGKVVSAEVTPYFIPSENGKSEHEGIKGNWVNRYSVPVFANESVETVFKQLGHELATEGVTERASAAIAETTEAFANQD